MNSRAAVLYAIAQDLHTHILGLRNEFNNKTNDDYADIAYELSLQIVKAIDIDIHSQDSSWLENDHINYLHQVFNSKYKKVAKHDDVYSITRTIKFNTDRCVETFNDYKSNKRKALQWDN